jgi:Calcium-activated potassium channel slowpoke-like RCK domain
LIAPLRFHGGEFYPFVALVAGNLTAETLKIAAAFQDVFLVEGDGHNTHTLSKVSVHLCRALVIQPEEVKEEDDDPYFADADTIFTVRRVLNHFRENDLVPPAIHVELKFETNLKFIEPEVDVTETSSRCCRPFQDLSTSYFAGLASKPLVMHRLVSEGSIFFSDSVTRILSNCYKSGGRISELVLLLLRQSRNPRSLICSAGLHMVDIPDEMVGKSFGEAFSVYSRCQPPIIVIGLFRTTKEIVINSEGEPEDRTVKFAVSSPPANTTLEEEDQMYILLNGEVNYLETFMEEEEEEPGFGASSILAGGTFDFG